MVSFQQWIQQLRSRQPSDLDARIARLELQYEKLAQAEKKEQAEPERIPTVVIEHVNIEHVHFDKLEHNNNFGNLGIKELGGKLNIGLNYSGPITGEQLKDLFPSAKKTATESEPAADGARPSSGQPVYNIRPKAL